ncbi:hypothetical protein C0580_01180 [Candidatus Parcubacteria bacterium]|nr:MAG: hypothetical protein C0580_01180 [Candidatus Parcubacteria bacterium]
MLLGEVEERVAVVEGRLVEDGGAHGAGLVDELGPHGVAGGALLPAFGQFHVLEQRVALDHVTELDAGGFELLAGISAEVGRQGVAVHEATLTLGLLGFDETVGIGHRLCQVNDRAFGGRVAGSSLVAHQHPPLKNNYFIP